MADNQTLRWLLYKQESEKFPYRLFIEGNPNDFLILSVRERWPGPNKKIYCLSEGRCSQSDLPDEKPIEDCSIVKIGRYGRRLNIILNRKTKKRCWFIFLKKEYKTKPGEFYDQIFWITQSSAKVRRPGAYIPKVKEGSWCEIIIDKRERYPYKFGYAQTKRENLPVGDYALVKDGKIVAVAERKTLDNMLHEIGIYDVLKATLQELSTYPYKAVVFESPYSDFMNPKRIKPYKASYVADILSDLAVRFSEIQFIFCGNRKFAQEWIYRWFLRINSTNNKNQHT
jgi:hypothetical protein